METTRSAQKACWGSTRTPIEILTAEAGKFKPPPPMVTPVEKRSNNKFCDFHNDKGYSTDECMQLKKQIEELVRAGKLSHLIKEIKQGRDQTKVGKKEAPAKDKSLEIYMVQPWHRMTRQKVTQSFARVSEITFPPLTTTKEIEGPLVIEAKIGGHMIHRMYVDGGSSTEVIITGIIGRPGIREIQAVPSIAHRMLKFPVDRGIVTICSTILIPAECVMVTTSSKKILREAKVRHENWKVVVHPNFLDQEVAIGGTLSAKVQTELCSLLKENLDIFAWKPADMTGVPRSVAEHQLNIREGYSPVRQKKRGQASERAKAIQVEVQKLVEAGIPGEVYYHDWLSNPIMVKKHDGSWRMCVDFTDLNKACPQDCYPLPEIDWKVESLCGYPFKCFLDAYKGYHQIQMAESDEEKTVFHTTKGQVGRNIEVYVDDLVIKSHTKADMLRDIDETFRTPEGIKLCPDKTKAVLQLPSSQTIKEGQSLNGKLASLNRFLSKSGTSLQATEAALVEATPVGSTQTEGGTDYIYGLELNYTPMEKLVLALVFAAKRTSVKGQILADFLVEKPDKAPPDTSMVEIPQKPWTLFTDGSSCVDGSGAGLILTSPEGTEFTYALRFQFTAYNNKAEYEALLAGLRIAAQMGVRNVYVRVDSKLVANQVLGTYIAKEVNMVKYLEKAKILISGFANFSISQVPRSTNKKADALNEEVATVVEEEGPTWMTSIMEYLKDETLPDDRNKASKLRIKARQYELLEGVLYRRSFLKPWLRCVGLLQADYVIREIHEGSCIAMDYFTMWIEAKAVATITGSQVKKFVWDNIVCRFSLLGEIVSDNVKYLQSNGLVERANMSLGEGIKSRLGEVNKNWIEELPHILWAHRTMIKSSHGDTPFSLTYGTEAVIPAEIGMPTYRTAVVDAVHNDEELRLNLDLLEERRERAAIREAKAKLKMTKYYNARVRGVTFRPGDFVYRSNDASHAVDGGKLGPKWEGPYEITEALRDGAYKLRSMDGTALPRTWNIANLKKCYL
ncbi:reverse transcriptase domain-containing protein [Tanacetum coccineum]|uniref:Reverse transcriptase domain-containing protein n=1 Tax=Tanacetum coccineum TaxID=301880 RepID=A0ABQ4YWL0_9ASTR